MTKSKIVVRRTKGSKRRPPRKLPVSVASLRWALVRRLLVAVPAGLFLGGMVATASGLESADAATEAALLYGLAFSITLFLAVTWLLGRHRRAAFAAAGGDPHAAGGLLAAQRVGEGPEAELRGGVARPRRSGAEARAGVHEDHLAAGGPQGGEPGVPCRTQGLSPREAAGQLGGSSA